MKNLIILTLGLIFYINSVSAKEDYSALVKKADSIVIAQLSSQTDARSQAPTEQEKNRIIGKHFVVTYGWKQPTYWSMPFFSPLDQPNDTQWVLVLKRNEEKHMFEIIYAVPYEQSAELYALLGQPEWTFTDNKDVIFY